MNYFAGLDVSLKRTAICIVDRDGNIVREGVTDSVCRRILGGAIVTRMGRDRLRARSSGRSAAK
jgi:hypothetical protein